MDLMLQDVHENTLSPVNIYFMAAINAADLFST